MDEVFALTLNSLHQDMNRLDRIAMNLANASTPGYKREVVAFRSFGEMVEATAQSTSSEAAPSMPSTMQVRMDCRPGSLRMTGEALDLALTGEAFFEVSTPDGPAYTRQGNFRLDAQGRLVTAQGHPVMGKEGEILLTTSNPRIDASGKVTDPNAASGNASAASAQLRLVRFENPHHLERLGEGLMRCASGALPVEEGSSQVRQGFLENANVSTMQEMAQLIQTMRHFESVQKITQGYDEMLGTAIRKLGDLS